MTGVQTCALTISDIQGLVYIPFSNKVDDVTVSLVKELSNQGYNIDNKKL